MEDEVSFLELTRYMRNQLLRDSDVMSMADSVELRVPFADRKLIETVASIPACWRLAPGKMILLDAISEIPEWMRNRPKQGFTFPFKDWVTTEWGDIFERIEAKSPVRLGSWYRTWCLFALEKFVARLNAVSRLSVIRKSCDGSPIGIRRAIGMGNQLFGYCGSVLSPDDPRVSNN